MNYNFRNLKRADERESNYRLLSEPVKLTVKISSPLEAEGTDAWETDGGATAPPPVETTLEEINRAKMTLRGARKQRAARAYVPRESIKIVRRSEAAPIEVVEARVAGKTDQEIQIAALEARIKELMEIVRKPIVEAETKKKSIEAFEAIFNDKRTRV